MLDNNFNLFGSFEPKFSLGKKKPGEALANDRAEISFIGCSLLNVDLVAHGDSKITSVDSVHINDVNK